MPPRPIDGPRARPALAAAGVALAAVVCYAGTLHAPFVFDDDSSILMNPSIGSWEIAGPFEPPTRAVAYTTLTLNYRLGGLDPFGYHLFNVAVHALAGLAVYALARVLLRVARGAGADGASWAPLAGALLFVVHPLQTQAVTYVVQRLASLATLFYVAALAGYAFARADGPARTPARLAAWLGAIASALLATFTKEIAFTLPLAVALLELAFFRGAARRRLAAVAPFLALLPIIPLRIASAGTPVTRVLAEVQQAARGETSPPLPDYLATQARVLVSYLRLVVFPVGQNLDPDFPVERSFASAAVAASLALLAALAISGAWLLRRRASPGARVAGFGVLLFFLGVAVEAGVPLADVMFEHRMYLPMAGVALAASGALAVALERRSGAARTLAVAVAVAVAVAAALAVLAGATIARNRVWRDPVSLWSDTVAKSPGKVRPLYGLAGALWEAGAADAACAAWQEVVRREPRHSWAWNQLGSAAMMRRDLRAAESYYRRALEGVPLNPEAYFNLALVLETTGRAADAVPLYRRFHDLRPLGRERELDRLRARFGWR